MLKVILEQFYISYTITSNGREVIEAYEKDHSYDLILMDINMPELNGVEALYEIRKYENKNSIKNIPVVALTANAIKGDVITSYSIHYTKLYDTQSSPTSKTSLYPLLLHLLLMQLLVYFL